MILVFLMAAGVQASDLTTGIILGGSSNAPIRIEVFSDFECPGCRLFYRELMLPTLQDYASKDKVCVIYHEFPLNQHRFAKNAACYCEAAYKIGRDQALRVIDALFSNQTKWAEDGNIEAVLAKALSKKDFSQLKLNLKDPSIDQSILQGIKLGNESGVHGTPTMFVYYLGRSPAANELSDFKKVFRSDR
jgi:protein-disulfide isomerase